METLEDIIEAFPEFLTDEPINGGDLVDFIGDMIANYESSRPRPPVTEQKSTPTQITDQDLLEGVILPREQVIEAALSWANQQSYAFAGDTLTSYCTLRNLEWSSDPMYSYITFKEIE